MRFSLSICSPGWGAVALSAGRFEFACTFSEGKKSCCSVLIRRPPAPTHTLTHIHSHTHTPTDTHSYIQYGNKPYAMYTRSYAYTYTPDAVDANFALAQCARRFAAACGLKSLHSFIHVFLYIAGRRYPNNLSFKSRLNYTCGVLRSFN